MESLHTVTVAYQKVGSANYVPCAVVIRGVPRALDLLRKSAGGLISSKLKAVAQTIVRFGNCQTECRRGEWNSSV